MLNEINNKIDQLSINNRRKEEPEMEFEENVEVTETSANASQDILKNNKKVEKEKEKNN